MCVNVAKFKALSSADKTVATASFPQCSLAADSSFFVLGLGGLDNWEQPGAAKSRSCFLGLFMIVNKAQVKALLTIMTAILLLLPLLSPLCASFSIG